MRRTRPTAPSPVSSRPPPTWISTRPTGTSLHPFFSPPANPHALCTAPSHRHIDAKVSLLPSFPWPGGNGGPYHVATTTSNGAIELAFTDAPPDYALTASARTSNGHVEVTTHETFEGSFDLSTTNARAPTLIVRELRDPAGRGRTRGHVVRSTGRTAVHGNVWWGEENRERGSVSVSTSNGRVQLTV